MIAGQRKNTVWIVSAVVAVIIVLGVAVYAFDRPLSVASPSSSSSTPTSSALTTSRSSSPSVATSSSTTPANVNLLPNGGFEAGNLSGWNVRNNYVPQVVSTGLKNMTYAAEFQTPGNGQDLVQCTTLNLDCGKLNVSTIFDVLPLSSVSRRANFSFAVDPSFSYPSGLQITLSFVLKSNPDAQNATIFYLLYTDMQQCESYASILTSYNTYHTTIFCLAVPQGQWTTVERSMARDLASSINNPSYLDGTTLTLSISFAGGNATDKMSLGSVFFG